MNYVVKSGDSLSKIGAQFGVPWINIANANGLKPPYTIKPGQTLNIPTGGNGGGGDPAPNSSTGTAADGTGPLALVINGVILYGIFRVLMKVF